jgi:hypothetical protein
MKSTWIGLMLILLATIAIGCSGQSHHHGQKMPDPEGYNAHFGDMDANSDGNVDWDEFKAYFPQAEPKVYAALDLNKDGFVDHDEWHEFKQAHGLKHKE